MRTQADLQADEFRVVARHERHGGYAAWRAQVRAGARVHDDMQPLIALREQVVEQLHQPLDAIAEVHHEHFEMRSHRRRERES